MGCASSVQVKKNEVSVAKSLDENLSSDKNEKDLHEDSLHQNKVDPTSSALNDLETTSSAGDHEHHQSSGYTSPVKEIAINVVPDVSDVKRDETNNEIEDVVDSTLKPAVLMKKHPTQDTLNFVYKNSLDNSESNTGNGFLPSSNGTGSCTGLSMHKYVDRRPSGVPPPVRALKPGDFLYQKTMSLPNFPDLSQVDTRNVILEKA